LQIGRLTLALLLAGCLGDTAHAHPFSQSASRLIVTGPEVRATLTINLIDLHSMPDIDKNRDNRISLPELDDAIERIFAAVGQHFVVEGSGAPIHTTVERYRLADETSVSLDLLYRFASEVTTIKVTSTLAAITQPNHRHLMSVTTGSVTHEAILDLDLPSARFDSTGARSYLRTFGSFLRLGVEHIFTGYDHLAFLVGLLIATASFRSLVKIVTSFTVAHSITLALATFDAVVLPTRVTESLIALSIAYVAAENLLRSRAIERYRITFLFGLVHGFGFSTILRQMQLPRRDLALSLFSFNAGVELGQILFVAIVFPMMMYLAGSAWQNRVRSAVSFGIVCLSMYWFVDRAFL
jgi:hydrogenase/urease accessory protein HupE